jgi:Tfp pilus assembly protein PilN
VRAVNLIPAEQRRGAGGLAGRTGGIVYVVAGGLLVIVALGVVYAFAVHSVADRKGQLAAATQQTARVQSQAFALQSYVQVASLRDAKVKEIAEVAEQRFNWPTAMQQLALALPSDVTFTAWNGVAVNAVSGTAGTTTQTTTGPAFTLAGCASSQGEVATVLSDLGQVPGVVNVSLVGATKVGDKVPNRRKGPVRRSADLGCPLVSFNLTLAYNTTYTLPNSKFSNTQTVGASSGSNATAHTASTKVTG